MKQESFSLAEDGIEIDVTLQVQWVARLYTSHCLQSPAKQQDFLTCKDNVVGWKIELL